MKYLMKCGHVNNSTVIRKDKQYPYCVICDCDEIEKTLDEQSNEGLEGRKAQCKGHRDGCSGEFTDSAWNLPFFEYKPNEPYDSFYCGCWGWD